MKSPKCKSCTSSNIEPRPITEMQFTAHRTHVTLTNGTRSPLNRAFINPLHKPSAGWSFQFILGGTQHTIAKKRRPEDVAAEVVRIYAQNGKTVPTADVWLNLNLYWLNRTDRMHWLVGTDELASAAKPSTDAESVAMATNTPPKVWGSRAWNWLGTYLAGNVFDPQVFLLISQQILDLLDPGTNPSTGCPACYLEFNKQMGLLRQDPPMTRQSAREWLWAYHNSVNKRLEKKELTFAQAAKDNFWTP